MILDVARHKFFEGLITLAITALLMTVAVLLLPERIVPQEAGGVTPISAWLLSFGNSHPTISTLLSLPLFFYAVLRLAQATTRTSLYHTNTMASISLGGLAIAATCVHGNYLQLITVAILTATAMANMCYIFRPTMRPHRLFMMSIALGTLTIIDGVLTLPTLIIIILTIAMRSALRETLIIAVGYLLPIFAYFYISWFCGVSLDDAWQGIASSIITSELNQLGGYLDLPRIILFGMMLIFQCVSSALYIRERLSLSMSARHVWTIAQAITVILILMILLMPTTSLTPFVVVSIIISTMIPMLFQHVGITISAILYMLFLVISIVAIF